MSTVTLRAVGGSLMVAIPKQVLDVAGLAAGTALELELDAQQRIVLTRDRDLLIRKDILHGCYVRALKAEPQAQQVLARYRLARKARPFTLCLHCNAPLHAVAKSEVEKDLPPQVRALHQTFRRCDVCRRVYWKGSHWQRMDKLLRRLLNQPG